MNLLPNQKVRRFINDLPIHLFLIIPNLSVLFLLYYLLTNTLKPKFEFYRSAYTLPIELSLSALENAITNGGMLIALRNSLILTGMSTLVAVSFGACAAYTFSKLKLPWKYPIFIAMLVPMSISPMIVTIPLFAQLAKWGLVNTFTGGILIYAGLQISFSMYVLEGIFRELPDELFEAAKLDGAGDLQIFFRILLPMAGPGLTAVALFASLATWNDLLIGLLFLSDPDVIPISANVVSFQQKFSSDPQMIFAGLFLAALPMLIIYALTQRFFVRGLMGGAFR